MFGWLEKDPVRALQKQHKAKLVEARDAQRGGDIQRFAALTAEAAEIEKAIDAAKRSAGS